MPNELEKPAGDESTANLSAADEKLLEQIRDDFTYCRDYWRENYEAAADDMQYADCNPWTAADLKDREGRPCICPDELSQYVKSANNNQRQNKREIVATPKGMGATDENAQHREAIIRGLQHASKAQSVYTSIFESVAWCAFGFGRINLEYVSESEEHVQPRIKRIPNFATVYMDPDAKEPDFSDAEICFVVESFRENRFAEKFPNAKKRSFTATDKQLAPGWFDGQNITVAEYFKVTKGKSRARKERKVMQYITNGVEILEKNEWIGSWIPIFGMFGEEIYVIEGGRSKRKFLSLIRRSKAPQKALAYIASQELEEFGMSPRVPLVGYKGQFDTDADAWNMLNKVPRPYVQLDVPSDWNSAWGVPPIPQRPQFVPNTQAYEMAFERYRRSVQSGMGLNPLPTAAQRQNEKSGVALEKIQTQEATGSFHLTDNLDRMLVHVGLQLNELITLTMDEPRQVAIQNQDETHGLLWVGAKPPTEAEQNEDYLVTSDGEFGITIATGPNFQSQREMQSNFVDTLLGEIAKMPIPPQLMMHLLGLAIKLKNIGPIGEEIAELLIPEQDANVPPQAQAAIQQAQGMIQQMGQKLQEYEQERQGKILEKRGQLEIEQFKAAAARDLKLMDIEKSITVAEIATKAQHLEERIAFVEDMQKQIHMDAHEAQMQAQEHAQQQAQAQQAAEAAAQQSDQGHQQTLEQQQQAAELAPEPQSGGAN